MPSLIQVTKQGLYCPPADAYIDPVRAVPRALITHAHSDHARAGHRSYLAHYHSLPILRARLSRKLPIQGVEYGETIQINNVKFSFHPAGHVLGSAQIRVEYKGEVWVISGDYKLEPDNVAADFEAVPCHVFVTESTFALPVYRWPDPVDVMREIDVWWAANQARGITSCLQAYSLGKAQRLLAGLTNIRGPIYVHSAVDKMNAAHLEAGVALPKCGVPPEVLPDACKDTPALLIAPPSVQGSEWMQKFGECSYAFASGWMALRNAKRRRSTGPGFVLSDHADWDGLNSAVKATGAHKVYVTHGYSAIYARWLRENMGIEAEELETLSTRAENTEREESAQVSESGFEDSTIKKTGRPGEFSPETQSAAGLTQKSKASQKAQAAGAAINQTDGIAADKLKQDLASGDAMEAVE